VDINRDAPATASAEAFIRAPLNGVWSILTNIGEWNRWNPDVRYVDLCGPLASGGADGKHGLYEFTQTHVVYMQRN